MSEEHSPPEPAPAVVPPEAPPRADERGAEPDGTPLATDRPGPAAPEQPGSAGPPRPAGYAGPGFVKGSIRLFRVFGIDVFLHWSWFIAAYFQFRQRPDLEADSPGWHGYSSMKWYVFEYLILFGIVLLHEFGHALACRSVGGKADRIYLWPFGGIAPINPPPRPGAFLWSIAAGPLVNLALVPVTLAAFFLSAPAGLGPGLSDWQKFLFMVTAMNLVLLLLNLLPIYPLDGGQLLQALLWYVLGRARSLLVVTALGLPITLGLLGYALLGPGTAAERTGLGLVAGFGVFVCLVGLQRARLLLRILKAPRREGFRCPACGTAPPAGEYWLCSRCRLRYDAFAAGGRCPGCGARASQTMCADCHQSRPFTAWRVDPAPGTPAADAEPRAPARPARPPAAPAFPFRERLPWAAGFAGAVLVVGLAVAGADNLVPVAVVALGGAMLGATGAETFSRTWRSIVTRRRLQGAWRLVEVDGKDLSQGNGPAVRVTITGTQFTEWKGDEVVSRGAYWLDPMSDPRPINIVPSHGPGAGGTWLGIYELDGGVWRLCVAAPGAPRPETLAAEPERRLLLVYRKE
jgi:uncharacterized protein (TIGR03067 family)